MATFGEVYTVFLLFLAFCSVLVIICFAINGTLDNFDETKRLYGILEARLYPLCPRTCDLLCSWRWETPVS